jgi:hypothetical protein
MPRKTLSPEERYRFAMRHELAELDNFVSEEALFADNLLYEYKRRGADLDEAAYRACAFFVNGEYKTKPLAVALLYNARTKLLKELPQSTVETAMSLLAYRFKVYGELLLQGDY